MMALGPASLADFGDVMRHLLTRNSLIELLVLALCLLLAWAAVRLARGKVGRPQSIWFGDMVLDGVLFPLLALLFVLAAAWGLQSVLPPAVLRLAVPILLSLLLIRLTVRVLRRAYPDSQTMRVVERSVSWVAWITAVLWLTGLLPLILNELDGIQWKLGASKVSLRNIIEGAFSAVVVLIIAMWVSSALEAKLLSGATHNLSIRKMAANALRALLLFIGLMFALSAAGIDLTALGVLGGALGVGLGFGLQKLASNYISGFVILAERSVNIGDMIKVDTFEGHITDITTRYTVVRALNGRRAIVPNELLITQRVENLSQADPRLGLSSKLNVAYGSDLTALLPSLTQAVAAVPRVLADPAPGVTLANFGEYGLELLVEFWIADADKGQANVRSDVNLAVLNTLLQAGVQIAVPPGVERVPER
jgi:small-conductance mechanosensitive channel